jgi:hypothetical protein
MPDDSSIKIQVYLPVGAKEGWQRLIAERGNHSASATATAIILDAINDKERDEIAEIKRQVEQTNNMLLILIYMMWQQKGGPLAVPEDMKEQLRALLQ